MCNKDDLLGKKALITGGSRGIGSAIALELAECGADIVLHYAGNMEAAQEMKDRILKLGRKCKILQADLRVPEKIEQSFESVKDVDILILNASIQYKINWLKIKIDEFHEQMNCNCLSSMLLMQLFVPRMQEKQWGRIVTVGSVQESKPHPDMLVYSSSKAAQTLMVKSLSLQLARSGITVNNIAPGVIDTDRNTEALSDSAYAKKVADSIPAGYFGTITDCAGIVRVLCSDAGRYVTGQNIYIDGGKGL